MLGTVLDTSFNGYEQTDEVFAFIDEIVVTGAWLEHTYTHNIRQLYVLWREISDAVL